MAPGQGPGSGPISTTLPPGPHLPHDDAGPRLVAVAWVLASLSAIFLLLRIYCKFKGQKGLWWDDYVVIASWVVLLTSCALTTHLVTLGFGKHTWDFPPSSFGPAIRLLAARSSLAITAVAWSKTAFAITLLRLTDGCMKKGVWFMAVSINIALGLAAMLPWLQCTPLRAVWDVEVKGTCWHKDVVFYLYVGSGAYSAAMDFVLALLPWKLVWRLQMRSREKLGIGIAMSMGVFAGATAITKTVMLPKLYTDDLYNSVDLLVWDIAESAVTIIAASIPTLRVLLRDAASTGGSRTLDDRSGSEQITLQNRWNPEMLKAVSPNSYLMEVNHFSDEDVRKLRRDRVLRKPT